MVRFGSGWFGCALLLAVTLVDTQAHALKRKPPATSAIARYAAQGTEVCIKAGNGQFMVVEGGDTRRVNANRAKCGPWETFRFVESKRLGHGIYNVAHKTFLSCQPNGRLEGNRGKLGPWEQFKIMSQGDQIYTFQCVSHSRHFVVAEGNGGREVNANRPKAGPWERFRVVPKSGTSSTTPKGARFPQHWGPQPQIQTKDLRPLPGGYGQGSSTLANWIRARMERDAKSGQYFTALQLNANATKVEQDIGRARFNAAFRQCPLVKYVRNGAVMAVYQRVSGIPSDFDAYRIFAETWRDTPLNRLNTNFRLFDSHAAFLKGNEPWRVCNYNDPDVAFPRDCGKTRGVGNRWFSLPGGRFDARGITQGVRFEIHRAETCPVTPSEGTVPFDQSLIRNGRFDQGMKHWTEYAQGPRINGLHEHKWGGSHITAHLHGNCPRSAGGMAQVFESKAGQLYHLQFQGYSGDWDGKDIDVVHVGAGDQVKRFELGPQHSVNLKNPAKAKPISMLFRAVGSRTQLSFYSDLGHCVDIDNVVVEPVEDKSPLAWHDKRQSAQLDLGLTERDGPFWVIAVTATKRRIDAELLALELRQKGLAAHMTSLKDFGSAGNKDLWLVYIGPFNGDERSSVRETLDQVNKSGIEGAYGVTLGRQGERQTL